MPHGAKVPKSNLDHFRPFPTGQLPFFSADANQVQCSRLPSRALGQEQKISMSLSIDENAIAHLVAKILAENLRGADVPATEPPLTIDAFCKIEGMSRATYYKLKRLGLGPELTEIVIPAESGVNHGRGLHFIRISADAHRAWREKIAQVRASEAAELEAARAREQRVEAARRAVASPAHISKRERPERRRRRRR
jgi:hypothetical protein